MLSSTFGARRALLAVGLIALLAACAQDGPPTTGGSGGGADTSAEREAPEPSDPIARFAVNAPQGASSQISQNGESVFVTVGPYYRSATGDRCRRVTMRASGGGSHVNAVCRQEGVWETVVRY
jgi:hypothetical protein